MRPPRLRCALFPLIYPPHLLVLPATFGLYLLLQTYPYFRALYVIPVRRTKSLLTASFRFHLAMDTLAVRLYTSSLPRRVRDLHPLERAHGAQTKGRRIHIRILLHNKLRANNSYTNSQGKTYYYYSCCPYSASFICHLCFSHINYSLSR